MCPDGGQEVFLEAGGPGDADTPQAAAMEALNDDRLARLDSPDPSRLHVVEQSEGSASFQYVVNEVPVIQVDVVSMDGRWRANRVEQCD